MAEDESIEEIRRRIRARKARSPSRPAEECEPSEHPEEIDGLMAGGPAEMRRMPAEDVDYQIAGDQAGPHEEEDDDRGDEDDQH